MRDGETETCFVITGLLRLLLDRILGTSRYLVRHCGIYYRRGVKLAVILVRA